MYCEKDAQSLVYAAVNMNWEEALLALPRPPKGYEWKLVLSTDPGCGKDDVYEEPAAEEAEIKDRKSEANESRTPARDDLKRIIPGRCVAFYEASKTETGNRISKKAGK